MRENMKIVILLFVFFIPVANAAMPDFVCTDIRGAILRTDETYYTNISIGKNPVPYGMYKYATDKDNENYLEINVVNYLNADGYYYGNLYTSTDGQISNEIRCKKEGVAPHIIKQVYKDIHRNQDIQYTHGQGLESNLVLQSMS